MSENDYEKNSTKYNQLTNFYLYKRYSDDIFEKLLHTNRVTLPYETYVIKEQYTYDLDHIYIRALYYQGPAGEANLLISNDARRRIISLYKLRIEQKCFKERLLAKMSTKFGYSLEEKMVLARFLDILRQERAFTAGSFPLQVFIDENWSSSDLDIFVLNSNAFDRLKRFLITRCATDKKLTPDDMKNSHYVEFNDVHEFTLHNGFRIQIIYANRGSIDSVISYFDFDFCKIAWCFSSDKLIIQNRRSIETRTCEYDLKLQKSHKCAERLQKYELRGFTVTNWKEMLEMERSKKAAKEEKRKDKSTTGWAAKKDSGSCTIILDLDDSF